MPDVVVVDLTAELRLEGDQSACCGDDEVDLVPPLVVAVMAHTGVGYHRDIADGQRDERLEQVAEQRAVSGPVDAVGDRVEVVVDELAIVPVVAITKSTHRFSTICDAISPLLGVPILRLP